MAQKKNSFFERVVKFLRIGVWYKFIVNDVLQITPQELKRIRNKES